MTYNFWILIGQDVSRPIGGVKQLFRFAESLASFNYSVKIVQRTEDFHPTWFSFSSAVELVSFVSFKKHSFDSSNDFIVLPETLIEHYFSLPNVPRIIFNQNFGYTYSEKLTIKPSYVRKVYSDSLLLFVLCISISDYSFLIESLLLPPSKVVCLPNPIETDLFYPSYPKNPTISFMPRKNTDHCRIVTDLISSQDWFQAGNWTLQPLVNLPLSGVASSLRSSFMFLAFGCPEGFGLPIAESLACGTHVVGYSGVGGNELFNIGKSYGLAHKVDYFDFNCFTRTVLKVASTFHDLRQSSNPEVSYQLNSLCSQHIRSLYSFEAFSTAIFEFVSSSFPLK